MTKYLFVGLGSIGTRHLKNLRAITDDPIIAYRSSHKQSETEKRYHVKPYFDYDKALDQKPDIVFITNPTSLHLPYALKAVKKGCHLFIEKPISQNLKGVSTLYSLADKQNTFCYVGFNFHFHPTLIKIKKIIDSKKIGQILFARIQVGQYLPDWHPLEDYRQSYSAQKKLGGGVLLTLIHELDYAHWLIGHFEWVIATCEKISNLKIDVEDTVAIIAKTKKNALVEIHLDYLQTPPSRNCEIIGSKGKITWDYFNNTLTFFARYSKKTTVYHEKKFERNQMFVDELNYFLKRIKLGQRKTRVKKVINDQRQSVIEVMKIVEAINKSSRKGKKVYV